VGEFTDIRGQLELFKIVGGTGPEGIAKPTTHPDLHEE